MLRGPRRLVALLVAALTVCGVVPSLTSAAVAAAPRPVVTSLSAYSGTAQDTVRVVVYGRHLGSVGAAFFGSRAAKSVLPLSTTRVQAFVPGSYKDQTVSVRVRSHGRYSAVTSRARYTFVLPPTLSRVGPAGALPAGRRVTVYGHEFRSVRGVAFGAVAGTALHVVSSTALQVDAPAHSHGTVEVRVYTAYGHTAPTTYAGDPSYPGIFRYALPPVVHTVTSPTGPARGGAAIQILGTNLAGSTSVNIGGATVRVDQVTDDHEIYATPPPHAPGTVDVRVTTPSGTSAASSTATYRYQAANADVWRYGTRFDRFRGQMQDISCADDTHCMAVDGSSATVLDGQRWSAPHRLDVTGAPPAVSCPTAGYCVVTAGTTVVTYADDNWLAPVAVSATPLTDISCSAPGACTALGSSTDGLYVLSNGSWTGPIAYPADLTRHGYVGWVTCPSTTCMVADSSGLVASYDGSGWSDVRQVDDTLSVAGLDCASIGHCVLADQAGYVVTLNESGWGPRTQLFPGEDILHVGCARGGLCAVTTTEENAAVLDGSSWTVSAEPIYPPPTVNHYTVVQAVTCASRATCIAVDAAGDSITYSAAAGWSAPVPTFVTTADLDTLSCPSVGFCAAADTDGNAFVRRDGVWSEPVAVHPGYLLHTAVSCTSASFCLLLLSDGTAAEWNGTAWSSTSAPSTAWTSVSCTVANAAPMCFTSAERFDGSSWSAFPPVPTELHDPTISCASANFCAAGGSGLLSVWNGTSWSAVAGGSAPSYGFYYPDTVSCPSVGFCLAASNAGHVWAYRSGAWSQVGSLAANGLSVSCTSSAYCQITGVARVAWTWDGTTVSESTALPVDARYLRGPTAVSCPSPDQCIALGSDTEYVSASA